MLDTYSAGEKKINGFESKDLYFNLKNKNKKIFYVGENDLNKIIYKETTKNNIIIFMGAGSISNIASINRHCRARISTFVGPSRCPRNVAV